MFTIIAICDKVAQDKSVMKKIIISTYTAVTNSHFIFRTPKLDFTLYWKQK